MKLKSLRTIIILSVGLILIGGAVMTHPVSAAIIGGADQGGRPLNASLSGEGEVPNPGDPDGYGTAFITFNQGQGEVCWELDVADIASATGAHIHRGSAGVAGPVVIPLSAPASGSSSGCTSADPALIKEIRQNPSGFYVNVHNADFPAGAIRGQLSK